MSNNIRNKAILEAAVIAVFAEMFCIGCYDLGIEPSVKTPTIENFVDIRDGKTYKKVKIGEQIWMGENLNYAADNSICYDNRPDICERYGRLYDWNTAMNGEPGSSANPSGVEGICPVGWHLPSNAEWATLVDYVGLHGGTKLKSHEFHINSETITPEGTDLYNFSALPGPLASYWWTATEMDSDSDKAGMWSVTQNVDWVGRGYADKHEYFFAVRCVHDY